MDIPTPQVFLRHNAFTASPTPITPLLTPAIPTHLTLAETTLPLRRLRLSHGLRRHEIAINHKTTTLFITPASRALLPSFRAFIAALQELTISPPNYTFTRLLARGAFGSVHSAVTPSHSSLAVKRVPLSNPLWRAERSILEHLPSHPNIIPVIETFTSKAYLHIVMPRLAPLSEVPQPLSLESALSLIRSLLSAVAHMHKYGVCHNDIKPDNLLLAPDAHPAQTVVTDFGLATYGPGKGGTQAYSAPYGTGPAADVWSVGVVAYVLVTGRMPWGRAKDRIAIVRRMMNEGSGKVVGEMLEKIFGNDGMDEVAGLLKGLLQVDPRKRLTARAALEHSVFGKHRARRHWGIKRVFKSILFGVRLDSLRGGSSRRTMLL